MDHFPLDAPLWLKTGPPTMWSLAQPVAHTTSSAARTSMTLALLPVPLPDPSAPPPVLTPLPSPVADPALLLPFTPAHLSPSTTNALLLPLLHEASLLSLIHRRFLSHAIYTFAGDILISVNPYHDTGHLTASLLSLDEFSRREAAKSQDPHPHVLAERAYQSMLSTAPKGHPQSILINGESGSGKTEIAKCIMRYLAQRSFLRREVVSAAATAEMTSSLRRLGLQSSAQLNTRGLALLSRSTKRSLPAPTPAAAPTTVEQAGTLAERAFLLANPLLEAFGNACTSHNHNSSRFGKYIQVFYSDDGLITSTTTRTFFLEKSRVTRRAPADSNFHVFHALLESFRSRVASNDDSGMPPLALPADFLTSSPALLASPTPPPPPPSHTTLPSILSALAAIALSPADQANVLYVLCVVLSLGEITFAPSPDHPEQITPSSDALAHLSTILCLDPHLFSLALCFRTIRIGKRASITYVPLPPHKAQETVHSLCQTVYQALFHFLVDCINDASVTTTASMGSPSRRINPLFLGILDIFGFEVLATNSLEQLCINYCNEILQRIFDHHLFDLELDLYASEGISPPTHSFRDNQPIIDLFAAKTPVPGLFRILDEQCLLAESLATDQALLSRFTHAHASSPYFNARPTLHSTDSFLVAHFAGPVTYTVTSFIQKNTDSLPTDLLHLLTSPPDKADSESPPTLAFLSALLRPCLLTSSRDENDNGRRLATLTSLTSTFRSSLSALQTTLDTTAPHFIRCIKPNADLAPLPSASSFNHQLVLHQLHYLSVMEICRVRSDGFPVRMPYPDFVAKFPSLLFPTRFDWLPGSNDRRATEVLLKSVPGLPPPQPAYLLGTTQVFLRDGVLEHLSRLVNRMRTNAAILIQKTVRGLLARRALRRRVRAARRIQRWWRALPRSNLAAAVLIQKHVRGFLARRAFERQRRAACVLQRLARSRTARMRLEALRAEAAALRAEQAATLIQSQLRRFLARRAYLLRVRSITLLQAHVRGSFCRRRFASLLESREKWADLLRPNEAVVLASMVTKTSRVRRGFFFSVRPSSSKQRQLILTTSGGPNHPPRLFYVDPVSRRWKGEIPWDRDRTGSLSLSPQDFIVFSKVSEDKADKEPVWHFSDNIGPAVCWVQSVRRAVSVLDLVRDPAPVEFLARAGLAHRGGLQMQSLTDAKRFTDMYVSLMESGDLWWYENMMQQLATGGCNVTKFSSVALSASSGNTFELILPGRPSKPLVFRAASAHLAATWVAQLERVIKLLAVDTSELRKKEERCRLLMVQAQALMNKQDFLNAKVRFKEAMDVLAQPEHASYLKCLTQRAKCNHQLGLEEKALDDCTQVLQTNATSEAALATRAAAFEALGRWHEALTDFETLKAVAPWSKAAEQGIQRAKTQLVPPSPAQTVKPLAPAKPFSGPIARHALSQQAKRSQQPLNEANAPASKKKPPPVPLPAKLERATSAPAFSAAAPPPLEQPPQQQQKKPLKKRQTSGSGKMCFARALANYSSGRPDDLELKAGDEIMVTLKYKDGWWKGTCRGKEGLFPSTYVEIIKLEKD